MSDNKKIPSLDKTESGKESSVPGLMKPSNTVETPSLNDRTHEAIGAPGVGDVLPDSMKKVESKPLTLGIEVQAILPGYIHCSRKVVGDKFTVASMSLVGKWMKCLDPVMEKKHKELMEKKKKQHRKKIAGN